MNKTNDDKIKAYKIKRIVKWIIVILSLSVIVLEVLALFKVISMFWGFIPFIAVYILKKMF